MQTRGDRRALIGGVLVALAGVQYGVAVVLGKWAVSEELPAQASLAIRFAIAALVLAVVLLVSRRSLVAVPGERRSLLLLGGVGYAVETSFFFAALGHGTVAGVTLLFYVYPVLAALAHMALGQGRPGPALFGALALSLAGAAVVIAASGGVAIDGLGIAFALGAAIAFTIYMLGSERFLQKTHPMVSALWLCGAASLGLALMATVTGNVGFPGTLANWAAIGGMGLATAGAFTCFLAGMRRIGAVRTGIISTFEPLSASALAFVFLAEPLGLGILAGGVLILAGAVIAVASQHTETVMEPLP